MKNSFILFTDYMNHLELLSMEQRGILLTALMCYQSQHDLPEMDSVTKMAFSFIKQDMDINNAKYEQTVEHRKEAGRLGGLAKASKGKQKVANASKSKQSLANVADNDNGNDNDNENVKEVKHSHGEYAHVKLKDSELESLNHEYGEVMTKAAITFLDEYIEMKGYKAKSHYLAIRKWVVDAVRERQQKASKTPAKGNKFQNFEGRQMSDDYYDDLEKKLLQRRG